VKGSGPRRHYISEGGCGGGYTLEGRPEAEKARRGSVGGPPVLYRLGLSAVVGCIATRVRALAPGGGV
jgi:hypothetical protein